MTDKFSFVLGFCVCAVVITIYMFTFSHDHHHDHHHHHHHGHDEEHSEDFLIMSKEQIKQQGIEIQHATSGTLRKILRAPATIVANKEKIYHILPKIEGNAYAAYKNLGDNVEGGEVLATIESREIAELKADYLAAEKKFGMTTALYHNERNLHEKKISAEQDFHEAQMNWEDAEIKLELAKQKLYAIGISEQELISLHEEPSSDFRMYALKSPLSGVVIKRDFSNGELLNSNSEPFVVADLSTVWAEIQVFPQDKSLISSGLEQVTVCQNGKSASAKIRFISPTIDEHSRTFKVIAELENTEREWIPGNFAAAHLIVQEISVPLVIPKEAVQELDGSSNVFIAKENGFEKRPIRLGREDDKQFEVLEGLHAGEAYACNNTFLLKAELKKHEAEHEH